MFVEVEFVTATTKTRILFLKIVGKFASTLWRFSNRLYSENELKFHKPEVELVNGR
jgi:hypothetical protein